MASTYTGVPGNVSITAAPTVTIPADGDALNASSVNAALQKLTDYVGNIYTSASFGIVTFGGIVGNTASTTYFAWLGGYRIDAMPTTNPGGSLTTIPFAFRIVGIFVTGGTNMAGGSCTARPYDGTGSVAFGPSVTINAGNNNGSSTTGPATQAAGRFLGFSIANGVGVTAGLGQFMAHVFITLA